jgi:hypothetical protein
MSQQEQVFTQRSTAANGTPLWGYRNRLGGRDAARVQKGGYASEDDARQALVRALERVPRVSRLTSTDSTSSIAAQLPYSPTARSARSACRGRGTKRSRSSPRGAPPRAATG